MIYPIQTPHGIMLHHFHGERHPRTQGSISVADLEAIIQWIGHRRLLDPFVWLEKLASGRLDYADVCLTFDDSLLCQFDIALPLLEEYRLRGFWFVYSSVLEGQIARFEVYRQFRSTCFENIDEFYQLFFARVLESDLSERAQRSLDDSEIASRRALFPFYSINDIKFRLVRDYALTPSEYEAIMDALIADSGLSLEVLADGLWMSNSHLKYLTDSGHIVGLHSYSHPMVFANLSVEIQREEYRRNLEHLRQTCGREPVAMAHPTGSYSDETLAILGDLGIRCGFRASLAPRTPGGSLNPSPLELAREDHANIIAILRA